MLFLERAALVIVAMWTVCTLLVVWFFTLELARRMRQLWELQRSSPHSCYWVVRSWLWKHGIGSRVRGGRTGSR
jgi:hypothetical protein